MFKKIATIALLTSTLATVTLLPPTALAKEPQEASIALKKPISVSIISGKKGYDLTLESFAKEVSIQDVSKVNYTSLEGKPKEEQAGVNFILEPYHKMSEDVILVAVDLSERRVVNTRIDNRSTFHISFNRTFVPVSLTQETVYSLGHYDLIFKPKS